MSQFSSSSDPGLEVSMAAMSAERASKPKHLVIWASLMLLITLGYMGWMISSRSEASQRLQRASMQNLELKALVQEYRNTLAASTTTSYEPRNDIHIQLQNLATESGLLNVTVNPKDAANTNVVKGYSMKQYSTTIPLQDPENMLRWIYAATASPNLPGLEVSRVQLKPAEQLLPSGRVAWNLDITFKRWERTP